MHRTDLRQRLDEFHAAADGGFVDGDEVVVTFRQHLAEGTDDVVDADDGAGMEQTAEDEHVEDFGVLHVGCGLHGVDVQASDVGARGRREDAVGVVDESAFGFYQWFELVERGLVEHDGGVVAVDDGRTDGLVADDDGDVGGAAALFGAVGGHPTHFLAFHDAGVGEDFT